MSKPDGKPVIKIQQVSSNDNEPRVRLVWGGQKWGRFLTVNELKDMIEELLSAYKILKERKSGDT